MIDSAPRSRQLLGLARVHLALIGEVGLVANQTHSDIFIVQRIAHSAHLVVNQGGLFKRATRVESERDHECVAVAIPLIAHTTVLFLTSSVQYFDKHRVGASVHGQHGATRALQGAVNVDAFGGQWQIQCDVGSEIHSCCQILTRSRFFFVVADQVSAEKSNLI
jgi:hypothetical protein